LNDLKNIPLHEYEQAPPKDFWLGLCSALDNIDASEKKLQEVGGYEVLPPADVWLSISRALDAKATTAASPAAPKTDTSPISIARNKEKASPPFFLGKKIVYMAVAACLIAGFFTIYQVTQQKNIPPSTASNTPTTPQQQPPVSPQPALPDSTTAIAVETEKPIVSPERNSHKKKLVKKDAGEAFVSNNIFEIEDEEAFFLTLANYILPANNNGKTQLSIRVDQYSSLNISPKLALFMQGLYERAGKKNKPTRTARRNYRALRSWKKASNKTFGEARMQNVADPFVLAEFLYKNRRM
jgi:hypothetical protein